MHPEGPLLHLNSPALLWEGPQQLSQACGLAAGSLCSAQKPTAAFH